jgi:hypothetical protein
MEVYFEDDSEPNYKPEKIKNYEFFLGCFLFAILLYAGFKFLLFSAKLASYIYNLIF